VSLVTVYLLHLDGPIAVYENGSRAGQPHVTRHYIGWAGRGGLRSRLEAHARGQGANMLRVAFERGVGWELVRTWVDGTRTLERYLKQLHAGPALCPVCNPGTRRALDFSTSYVDRYTQVTKVVEFHRRRLVKPRTRFRCDATRQEQTS
jgi:hypothetical protein